MVASGAIAAGTPTQAAAGAAQRAADAAGGNPAAVAAYRARAGQQAGALAGNAATNAQVAGQQALSGETANVGQTRLGQQGQALNYLSGLQSEQNQNAQNAANRQVQGAGLGLQASQTPSTFDKVMGGIGGGLSALLDEGAPAGSVPSYRARGGELPGIPPQGTPPPERFLEGGRPAVVAEKDPEAVVKMPNYMDDGDFGGLDMSQPNPGLDGSISESITPMSQPQAPSFLQQLSSKFGQSHQQPQQQQPTYGNPNKGIAGTGSSNLGKTIGSLGSLFLDDGGPGDGAIFTKPTKLSLEPDEAVVPLSYRANAKARPSMAMPLVDKINAGKGYKGLAKGKAGMEKTRMPHV